LLDALYCQDRIDPGVGKVSHGLALRTRDPNDGIIFLRRDQFCEEPVGVPLVRLAFLVICRAGNA